MSSTQIKRIRKDIRDAVKGGLMDGSNGIYLKPDNEDITKMTGLIIGPEKTPYEGGFFFFDIIFPNEYPLKSPSVKFGTLNPYVRFNPNLYTDGKVCLSLLGTWHGPAWTACCSISTVMLSIQALVLTENPLVNEPGFETAHKNCLIQYDLVVEYYTYAVAVSDMLEKSPFQFEPYKDELFIYFYNNFDKYIERINSLRMRIDENSHLFKDYDKGIIDSGVYNMCDKPDFDLLLTKFISLKEKMDGAIAKPNKVIISKRCDTLNMFNSYELISHYANLLDISLEKDDTSEEGGAGKESIFKKCPKSKKELLCDIEVMIETKE